MSSQASEEVPFLSAMEREPKKTVTLQFQVDGLCQWRQDIDGKLRHVIETTEKHARDVIAQAQALIMRAVGRGPDPDAVTDYGDLQARLNELERQVERRQPPTYYSNGNEESNWKTIALYVMGFLQAAILAIMGYMYNTMAATHDDVTTIKCQLNPQCRVVLSANDRR